MRYLVDADGSSMRQSAGRLRCGSWIASAATGWPSVSSPAILPLTDPIIERFARLRAYLRQHGQLIPDMDLLIAATALDAALMLVTRNRRHFERISDLTLYQPS